MVEVCKQCGEKFERIGTHWSTGSCHYPSFTDHQKEVITGVLMGDGSISRSSKNPSLSVGMISENYLKHLDYEFGVFGCGVELMHTAEEGAKKNRESGFRENAKACNYSDVYLFRTRNHPELDEFAQWYSSGEKVWPEDIELTPTVLKHWYCGDGHWDNRRSQNHIEISMDNEVENTDKVEKMFTNVGLPKPTWSICDSEYGKRCIARFTIDQSHNLWEYMGKPLPDFKYKWPSEYHNV